VNCDGDECIVDPGTAFTLIVSVTRAPSLGHIGIGTQVNYQHLIYSPTDQAAGEIVVSANNYPGIALRAPADPTNGRVDHGMTAGTPPNFTPSQYVGPVVELAMRCTDEYSRNDVDLAPYSPSNTLGSGFKLPNGDTVAAGATLLIRCGPVPPGGDEPTATATRGPGTPPPADSPEGQATATAEAEATAARVSFSATATAAALEAGGDDDDGGGSNTGVWIALAAIGGVMVLLGVGYTAWRRYGPSAGGDGGSAGPAAE
jgi:hypothetical protein